MHSSLAPWLTVADGRRAVSFYRSAFGAEEVYRLDGPDGSVVVRLVVGEAEFWVSGEATGGSGGEPPVGISGGGGAELDGDADAAVDGGGGTELGGGPELGGGTVRMILTVDDPDAVFARALAAGGVEVFPVGEGHGWRLGRLVDPFGLHWEVGKMLD
ncbi:MAG TPA: VOC family protein [Puia sp.]|jgi:PhnB protein|nr:VOC family protein [Puia sp.]